MLTIIFPTAEWAPYTTKHFKFEGKRKVGEIKPPKCQVDEFPRPILEVRAG